MLLARGEERTRADNEKLQKTKNNLANFSIGDEESNLYEFEGQDYSAAVRSKGPWSLNLPKRSTKQNYDENEYYRSMLNKDAGPRGPRAPKQLQVPDVRIPNAPTQRVPTPLSRPRGRCPTFSSSTPNGSRSCARRRCEPDPHTLPSSCAPSS